MENVWDRYYNNVLEDAKEYCADNLDYYTDEDGFDIGSAMDDMFVSQVTGNDDGSYFCNSYKAKEMLQGWEWDEDIVRVLEEMGENLDKLLKEGPETLDVIIRCGMLGYVTEDLVDYIVCDLGYAVC